MPQGLELLSRKTIPGLRAAGNINLLDRPRVQNPDGSVSTVRSISFGTDKGEVLVPTVSEDGRIMSDNEAINQYRSTGRHLGIFDSPSNADAYASALHDNQASLIFQRLFSLSGLLNKNRQVGNPLY